MTNYTYDLKPVYERVKSYYGKAYVHYERDFIPESKMSGTITYYPVGGRLVLYSYDRKVCALDYETGEYVLYGANNTYEDSPFTMTTRRHIKEFLRQGGVDSWNNWNDLYNNATGIFSSGKWIAGHDLHARGVKETA